MEQALEISNIKYVNHMHLQCVHTCCLISGYDLYRQLFTTKPSNFPGEGGRGVGGGGGAVSGTYMYHPPESATVSSKKQKKKKQKQNTNTQLHMQTVKVHLISMGT